MRILVLGGTGFIGRHAVRALAGDHEVAIYHRGRTQAPLPANVREFVDPESTIPIVRFPDGLLAFAPDMVLHTMAMGEADGAAFASTFGGAGRRLMLLSSGDVYRAYGRLTGIEPGPVENGKLREDSPLRSVLFPYRAKAASADALEYWYDKILAERALRSADAAAVILRLPKVYGPEGNADLATVYRFRAHPHWRWTHGCVGNVAAAIALAATHPDARGIYNVGEEHTPTTAERLSSMPPAIIAADTASGFNFAQDIAYDTSRIRNELGYREVVGEDEAMRMTLGRSG